jgi:DNA modification methylase
MELILEQAGMKLYQGDARAMLEIPDASVHLIVTSPPYFNGRDYSTWPSYAAYLADMALAWQECYRVLVRGGRIAVVVPDGYGRPSTGGYRLIGDDTARGLQAAGFELRGKVIWDKQPSGLSTTWGSWRSATSPALRDCHEVILGAGKAGAGQAATPISAEDGHEVVLAAHKLEGKRARGQNSIDKETYLAATASVWRILPVRSSWHPAPFPIEIPRRLIQLYSFAGDVVLDPFAGTGTTVLAAAQSGRLGIGVELHQGYAAYAALTLAEARAAGSSDHDTVG